MGGVTLKGFDAEKKKMRLLMPTLNKEVAKLLKRYGNLMVRYARTHHKFKTQTGQGERSITAKVDSKKWQLHFFIDEVRVYSNGYNYMLAQNDGFGQGYKQGKISPSLGTKVSTKGLKADDFMGDAWDKYVDALTADLQKLLVRVLGK